MPASPKGTTRLTCASCGRAMVRVALSLPQGQATCHPCRRAARGITAPKDGKRTCPTCKTQFAPKTASQRYCSQPCWRTKNGVTTGPRRRTSTPKGSTTARGYGAEHQRKRQEYGAIVASGQATCWRCGAPIHPGSTWDLGHDDRDRTRYRGPEHPACNRAAGARKANATRRAKHNHQASPLRW